MFGAVLCALPPALLSLPVDLEFWDNPPGHTLQRRASLSLLRNLLALSAAALLWVLWVNEGQARHVDTGLDRTEAETPHRHERQMITDSIVFASFIESQVNVRDFTMRDQRGHLLCLIDHTHKQQTVNKPLDIKHNKKALMEQTLMPWNNSWSTWAPKGTLKNVCNILF